jgi:hypothetical protein
VEFRTHIRQYNKVFVFTSSGGPWRLDSTVFDGCGPQTYKIQGELYHQIGPLQLEEGHAPLYSQLYIYNPSDALEHHQNNNPQTRQDTMAFLQRCLMNCNPFVTVYAQADALTHSNPMPDYRLRLDFLEASDQRHYNLPTMSRFPLALSRKSRKKRSCTHCESMHMTLGINTRQTLKSFIGVQKMKTTAWLLDAWSSPDRRG